MLSYSFICSFHLHLFILLILFLEGDNVRMLRGSVIHFLIYLFISILFYSFIQLLINYFIYYQWQCVGGAGDGCIAEGHETYQANRLVSPGQNRGSNGKWNSLYTLKVLCGVHSLAVRR